MNSQKNSNTHTSKSRSTAGNAKPFVGQRRKTSIYKHFSVDVITSTDGNQSEKSEQISDRTHETIKRQHKKRKDRSDRRPIISNPFKDNVSDLDLITIHINTKPSKPKLPIVPFHYDKKKGRENVKGRHSHKKRDKPRKPSSPPRKPSSPPRKPSSPPRKPSSPPRKPSSPPRKPLSPPRKPFSPPSTRKRQRKKRKYDPMSDIIPSDSLPKKERSKTKNPSKLLVDKKGINKYIRDDFYNTKIRGQSVLSNLKFNPYKIYDFGEKGSGFRTKGEVQDFYQLRDRCVGDGSLFEDPQFPCNDSSLYYSQRPNRNYEWKRPSEIVDDPQLFVEGYSRFDVQQGELGDCWLLAAVANLTLYRRLFFQVVPDDQSFDDNYAGIFHFRFWQYGRWIDVVIDDRLPTYRGELIFLHSTEKNEFWSALLEKAYAKLHGSYEALKGGSTCEAMEDFTGGVTEMYEMEATPPNLFKIVLKAFERASLMGCSIEPDPNVLEAETADGLIRGHAYSITRVKYVDIQTPNSTGKIPLLRLRNPWGNEAEWNGPWSDKSPEWRFIPEQEKQDLGLNFDDDGEFWMSFKDFTKHFDRMEICNLNPDSLSEEDIQEGRKRWEVSFFEGEWVRGVTAGGCRNFIDTFWNNPQYRITLTEIDDDDEDEDGKCTLIVALMQKNRRSQRNMGIDVLTIGFAIYHLAQPDRAPKPLDLNFFKYNASVARSPSFINLREVSCRFKLPPGTYAIVPSTFDPNEEGEFLLRVFSEHQNNMEENDDRVGFGIVDRRLLEQTKQHIKIDIIHNDLHGTPLDYIKEEGPTPEDNTQADRVYDFFLSLAGDDQEVDWKELKEILDYSMREELSAGRLTKDTVRGVESTQNGQIGGATGTTQSDPNDVIKNLLSFLCGTFCKDTPLAEFIPAPAETTTLLSSASELHQRQFSKDICRSMVAMLDDDKSGKLGFEEFQSLWLDIRMWKNVFKLYDNNNSGNLSGFELRQALNSAGYTLNNPILNILMHRYGNKQGLIEFDDFIMCAVKLKTMIELYKGKDPEQTDSVSFSLDEWLEKTLYC